MTLLRLVPRYRFRVITFSFFSLACAAAGRATASRAMSATSTATPRLGDRIVFLLTIRRPNRARVRVRPSQRTVTGSKAELPGRGTDIPPEDEPQGTIVIFSERALPLFPAVSTGVARST